LRHRLRRVYWALRSGRGAHQIRQLLLVGFGGLLLLLALTGFVALSVLGKIEARNDSIRRDYVNRNRILEQLRSDVYLSGTFVRDLLLEPDPRLADAHRQELKVTRARIETMIGEYDRMLRGEERAPFEMFSREVKAYFDSLTPALGWNADERRSKGYEFMKTSLLPRRMTIVRLADQIRAVNERQMEAGTRQVADLFASFRHSFVLLLVFTLFAGALLAGGSIYRILRLERLSARRFEEIESARGALRDLSARLLQVQEAERRALSRELHDEVGQSLSAVLLGVGNAAASLSEDNNPEAREQLQELRRLAERTVAVVRDMSLLLRPSMLDDLGLIPALEWQAREVSRMNKLHVEVSAEGVSEDLSEEHKTCVYRVVQEALRNVTRHASAKNAHVTLVQDEEQLRLEIRDDGQGFTPAREKGIGLLGMEERVMHLGGSFTLNSEPGKGTRIRVAVPLRAWQMAR
jgi:signal transduction histidine kinase